MAPIRVGLIGLSSSTAAGTNWAGIAHLPYLKASPHYEVVALLNSSVESAKEAIRKHELPSGTKAYGDPADLASDPNVDLVVCSVRVDKHFSTVRPSIIAGKAIFVEWPLEKNSQVAREMAQLAAAHNARTIVGLQGPFAPVVRKLKQVIENGTIGRVLSSHLLAALGNAGANESSKVSYFLDRHVGGNVISIHAGHIVESVTSVLGEFKSFNSLLAISRPTKDIVDRAAGNKVVEANVPNTVPDQISVQGITSPSDALLTINLHGGKEIPGTPQLDWRIQGEKGWLRVTSSNCAINVGSPDIKLELFDAESGRVEALDRDEWDELPLPAQNTARLYEAYRKNEWHPTFDWAAKRHELIDEMWKRFDEGK